MRSLKIKFVELERLAEWRESIRSSGQRLVATNGCFDILHAGHVALLEQARTMGDLLIVGLNSDASVKSLKGPSRPINTEADRAAVIASLWAVDAVTIFPETRADAFLRACKPDVWVKGGDYSMETLDPSEKSAVQRIVLIPTLPGYSTTSVIDRLSA